MKYPTGEFVSVGDHIWWDGGTATGHIVEIFEERKDYESVGFSGAGVFISHNWSRSSESNTYSYVGYLESQFEEDGIGLISTDEEAEIQKVISAARLFINKAENDFQTGVFCEYKDFHRFRWKVVFYSNQEPKFIVYVDCDDLACSYYMGD